MHQQQRVSLLVIEDEESALVATGDVAARLGYRVFQASVGDEAVVALETWRHLVQAVVLDWTLACSLIGAAIVKALRELTAAPIVILSGDPEEVRPRLGSETGIFYMWKPYLPLDLEMSIQRCLNAAS